MSSAGSITVWLDRLKSGDAAAVQPLWEAFFRRLVGLARSKLRGAPRRIADEEDVALSAFDSFFRAAEAGRFPQLEDRDDLWQLLLMITSRKAADVIERENRQKRGSGQVQNISALAAGNSSDASSPVLDAEGRDIDPQVAVQVAEELERLLQALGDPELRSVAVWRMEGYTNAEIAEKLKLSVGTIERKLRLVRQVWEETGLV